MFKKICTKTNICCIKFGNGNNKATKFSMKHHPKNMKSKSKANKLVSGNKKKDLKQELVEIKSSKEKNSWNSCDYVSLDEGNNSEMDKSSISGSDVECSDLGSCVVTAAILVVIEWNVRYRKCYHVQESNPSELSPIAYIFLFFTCDFIISFSLDSCT